MKTTPWRQLNPKAKGEKMKLSPESIAKARAAAKLAGRRYPNLIDNMKAAREQREREHPDSGSPGLRGKS